MQELKNAGFEDSTPNNWGTLQTGTMQIYTYPEPGRISGSSVSIEYPTIEAGQTAMWAQNVYVDHSKTYKLSGWLRTLGIIGTGASIKVDWKNSLGEYLSRSTIMTPQKGTTPWTYVEGNVTPDQNAVMATVNMELYDCSGKAWFDDISFSETVPGAKYKCSGSPNYICTAVTDGTGTYNTLAECQAACKAPVTKYKCSGSPNYICTAVTDGTGTYNTLAECQAACKESIISSITISPTSASININDTQQLSAVCKDQYGNVMTCPSLTWKSDNINIATVDSTGNVTGKVKGVTNITASCGQ